MSKLTDFIGGGSGGLALGEVTFLADNEPVIVNEHGTLLRTDVIVTDPNDVDPEIAGKFTGLSVSSNESYGITRARAAITTDDGLTFVQFSNTQFWLMFNALTGHAEKIENIAAISFVTGDHPLNQMIYDSDVLSGSVIISGAWDASTTTGTHGFVGFRFSDGTFLRLTSFSGGSYTNHSFTHNLFLSDGSTIGLYSTVSGYYLTKTNIATGAKTIHNSFGGMSGDFSAAEHSDKNGVVLAASEDDTYYSTDFGVTFTKRTNVGVQIKQLCHVSGDTWIAVTGTSLPSTRLYKSTDNGQTWSLMSITTGSYYSSSVVNIDGVLFASRYHSGANIKGLYDTEIIRSTDGGDTWEILGVVEGMRGGVISHVNRVTRAITLISQYDQDTANVISVAVFYYGYGILNTKIGSANGYVKVKNP